MGLFPLELRDTFDAHSVIRLRKVAIIISMHRSLREKGMGYTHGTSLLSRSAYLYDRICDPKYSDCVHTGAGVG